MKYKSSFEESVVSRAYFFITNLILGCLLFVLLAIEPEAKGGDQACSYQVQTDAVVGGFLHLSKESYFSVDLLGNWSNEWVVFNEVTESIAATELKTVGLVIKGASLGTALSDARLVAVEMASQFGKNGFKLDLSLGLGLLDSVDGAINLGVQNLLNSSLVHSCRDRLSS